MTNVTLEIMPRSSRSRFNGRTVFASGAVIIRFR